VAPALRAGGAVCGSRCVGMATHLMAVMGDALMVVDGLVVCDAVRSERHRVARLRWSTRAARVRGVESADASRFVAARSSRPRITAPEACQAGPGGEARRTGTVPDPRRLRCCRGRPQLSRSAPQAERIWRDVEPFFVEWGSGGAGRRLPAEETRAGGQQTGTGRPSRGAEG